MAKALLGVTRLLSAATSLDDLGLHLGCGLYAAEAGYLEEFAQTDQDILWRRSKQGLHVSLETEARLARSQCQGRTR